MGTFHGYQAQYPQFVPEMVSVPSGQELLIEDRQRLAHVAGKKCMLV